MTARQEQGQPFAQHHSCIPLKQPQPDPWCPLAVGQLQPGDCLAVSNAQVDMFKSSMRLTAGANGTVTKTDAADLDVNVRGCAAWPV